MRTTAAAAAAVPITHRRPLRRIHQLSQLAARARRWWIFSRLPDTGLIRGRVISGVRTSLPVSPPLLQASFERRRISRSGASVRRRPKACRADGNSLRRRRSSSSSFNRKNRFAVFNYNSKPQLPPERAPRCRSLGDSRASFSQIDFVSGIRRRVNSHRDATASWCRHRPCTVWSTHWKRVTILIKPIYRKRFARLNSAYTWAWKRSKALTD